MMVDLKLDTHKLKDFPGIELALGWINSAHDYICILDIETLLRQQEAIDEELQLPKNYTFYFARLRAAQAREAIGLCKKTKVSEYGYEGVRVSINKPNKNSNNKQNKRSNWVLVMQS